MQILKKKKNKTKNKTEMLISEIKETSKSRNLSIVKTSDHLILTF